MSRTRPPDAAGPEPPTLSDATLAHGERVRRALLGVDALYRDESGDETGLVVLDMDVGGTSAHDDFGGYGEAAEQWRRLEAAARDLPEPDRRVYYGQLAASTLAFIEWRRDGLPFEERLRRFLRVPPRPAADDELAALRRALGEALAELGYEGDLRSRCAAWEARNRVEPEYVEEEANALLDDAWRRTEEVLLPIPAPPADGMRVSAVHGVAYNARCDYLARTVDLNVDPVLTRPGLRHLAVHEGCPGHYLQFKLREVGAREGTAPADGLLSVVNTASSSVFEGIADAGLEMLGWHDRPDDRVQGLMNRYRAAIGTVAAWRLHADAEPAGRVADGLRSASLAGGEGWVENRMKFIAAPGRAVLIWSYWWGEPVVTAAWRAVPPEDRPAFLVFLYGRMHSNDSVGMFGA